MLTRREFLGHAVEVTVGLVLVPFTITSCSSSSSESEVVRTTSPTEPGCDGAGATSSVAEGHAHSLCVPAATLSGPPPEGVTLATTTSLDHQHEVKLTQAQLETIAAGGSVSVVTSVTNGHTHGFSIRRASQPSTSPTVPGPGFPY